MKRDESPKRPRKTQDGMRTEYRFDYAKARSDWFVERMENGVVAVILDPDVATVIGSSQVVNAFLRSISTALPVWLHKRVRAG